VSIGIAINWKMLSLEVPVTANKLFCFDVGHLSHFFLSFNTFLHIN